MDTLLPVILLGLSVEGLVICPFFTFGVSLASRAAGLEFLAGRLFGIVCLGALLGTLGTRLRVDARLVNVAFGAAVIAMGLGRIVQAARRKVRVDEPGVGGDPTAGQRRCAGPGFGGGACGARGGRKDRVGFGLGLFRGLLNPGRKHLYLAPLTIGVGALKGAAISFVFGLSSSVYLALGFLSAGLVGRLVARKQPIAWAGGLTLVAVGVSYVWRSRDLLS